VKPGSGQATARAVSLLGNATASALQTGGAASPSSEGIRADSYPVNGGTGGNSVMTDQVSGAAGSRLTLDQEVFGGIGSSNGSGGNATSVLHAVNPLGGELVARTNAQGGNGMGDGGAGIAGDSAGGGGSASSSVTATDSSGKYVEADAIAHGGQPGYAYYGYSRGGSASANATAQGLGPVLAQADTQAAVGGQGSAISAALASGSIAGAHAALAGSGQQNFYTFAPAETLHAQASVGLGAGTSGAVLPQTEAKQAFLAAAPTASDVASWTAGHPNAQAALADHEAVALGSLGFDTLNDTQPITGSLEVDLASSTYGGPSKIALAFLDPLASGMSFELLHLRFSIDGTSVFDQSFSDAPTAVAGLADQVVDLGTLGPSAKATRALVLSFEFDGPAATTSPYYLPNEGAFALDLALLAHAAVPEPSALALLAIAAAALSRARLHTRRARSH
jgi:hypothetical protein